MEVDFVLKGFFVWVKGFFITGWAFKKSLVAMAGKYYKQYAPQGPYRNLVRATPFLNYILHQTLNFNMGQDRLSVIGGSD